MNFLVFKSYKIKKVALDIEGDFFQKKLELQQELKISCQEFEKTTEEPTSGYNAVVVTLEISISDKDKSFNISVSMDGYFEINKDTDSSKKRLLLEQNAPAILYPYLRSFIASMTSQMGTGMTTLTLPVANFTSTPKEN